MGMAVLFVKLLGYVIFPQRLQGLRTPRESSRHCADSAAQPELETVRHCVAIYGCCHFAICPQLSKMLSLQEDGLGVPNWPS